jgi:dTDP-4-dehydrorhamnose reductase
MDESAIFIIGANGQLGLALKSKYPNARSADSGELDITNIDAVNSYDWSGIKVIINAAAYTNVDQAETSEGRVITWQVNSSGVANLVKLAESRDITLVHVSTEYVFDGTKTPHTESEPFSPLGVYGQSKAAGDIAASLLPKHYIVRTSWVIGEGKNFVRTMISLGQKGVSPTVVSDQIGRLTFTSELVKAIDYLLTNQSSYGIYNVSNSGESVSWADVTRAIFNEAGFNLEVKDTTTSEYFKDRVDVAPRPLESALDLTKLIGTGFVSTDWKEDLSSYIKKELQ